MWKKTLIGFLIAVFFIGSLGMIGWIGFQERLRLTIKALEQEEVKGEERVDLTANTQDKDYSTVETKEEAGQVVKHLEGLARTLEEDNLPSE